MRVAMAVATGKVDNVMKQMGKNMGGGRTTPKSLYTPQPEQHQQQLLLTEQRGGGEREGEAGAFFITA